jgi:hypothetical protein
MGYVAREDEMMEWRFLVMSWDFSLCPSQAFTPALTVHPPSMVIVSPVM